MLLIGLEMAWVSPVLVKLRDSNQTILSEPITDEEATWIASLASITGVAGTFNLI